MPNRLRLSGAVVAVSSTTLTGYLAGAILLLGLASVLTQSLTLATGSDYVFGLVPKLSPAGTRNIPVWFASAAFAICAASAAIAAFARRPSGAGVGQRWSALAVMFAVLSAERLAALVSGLQRLAIGRDTELPTVMLFVTAVVTAVVYAWCIHDLPRRIQTHFVAAAAVFAGGVALCAFAPPSQPAVVMPQRVTHMFMMSTGRLLELTGVTLFLEAVAVYLRSQVDEVRVVVTGGRRRLMRSRRAGDVLFVRLSAPRIRRVLTAIAAGLLTAGLLVSLGREMAGWRIEGLYQMICVDFEGNLPTWFSSLLLLACAVSLACIAAARHHARDGQWRPWAMLGLLFAGMSADEAAGLHELTVLPLRSLVADNPWLRYPLILPGVAGAALVCGVFARFFRSLPAETRRGIGGGFGLILLGALGVETIGGWFDPVVHGPSVTYVVLSTVEEGLEMIGAIVVLDAVMRHIERHVGTLRIPGCEHPALAQGVRTTG